MYLTQIPAAVDQSLKRADDPTGLAVPPALALKSANDSETKIGDAAGAWLAKMPRLRTLSVNRTRVGESGVDVVRTALPGCAVTADDLPAKS